MGEIWNIVLIHPLLNGLIFFYKISGNLGIAIILFTVLIRLVLVPLTLPSIRSAQKMKELAPHLERLKRRHKDDKEKFKLAQLEFYRQHGVNPVSGCLPQIIQIIILFALFRVFFQILGTGGGDVVSKINSEVIPALQFSEGSSINLHFLYLDLTKPDVFHISGIPFPIPGFVLLASAAVQFISSKMMLPVVKKEEKEAKKTKGEMDDFMVSMQQNMLWIFPITTIFIGFSFPSGLVLYWFFFSLFQVVQQKLMSNTPSVAPVV